MKVSTIQASKSKRLGNYIIDLISLAVLATIIILVTFGISDEYPKEGLILLFVTVFANRSQGWKIAKE